MGDDRERLEDAIHGEPHVSPRDELEALRDADLRELPREALVATVNDLAEQLLELRRRIETETLPRMIELENGDVRMRAALDQLTKIGDEDWKKPGHPMNAWVGKDTVHGIARRGLLGH